MYNYSDLVKIFLSNSQERNKSRITYMFLRTHRVGSKLTITSVI